MKLNSVVAISVHLLLLSQLVPTQGGRVECSGGQTINAKRAVGPAPLEKFGGVYRETLPELPGCQETDRFKVSVIVYDHIWLRFDPIRPPASNNCSTYFFDSQMYEDPDTNKTVSVGVLQDAASLFDNVTEGIEEFSGGWDAGEVTTADLIDAIDTFDGEFGEDYDIVNASCAAKIIQVMTFLGLRVDNQSFLDWMAAELTTDYVGELLRNSSNINLLYPSLSTQEILAKNDSELIFQLVMWQAARELEMYNSVLAYFQTQRAPSATPKAAGATPQVSTATPTSTSTGRNPVSSTNQPAAQSTNSSWSVASNISQVAAVASTVLVFLFNL